MPDVHDLLGPHEAPVSAESADHRARATLDNQGVTVFSMGHSDNWLAVYAVCQRHDVARPSHSESSLDRVGEAIGGALVDDCRGPRKAYSGSNDETKSWHDVGGGALT